MWLKRYNLRTVHQALSRSEFQQSILAVNISASFLRRQLKKDDGKPERWNEDNHRLISSMPYVLHLVRHTMTSNLSCDTAEKEIDI